MSHRFVILEHALAEGPHYDLMLERPSDLATWSFREQPRTPARMTGRRIQPHRKHYLAYEGPLSRGRGTVRRVDEGTFRVLDWTGDRVDFVAEGRVLNGRVSLAREQDGERWTFTSERAGSKPPAAGAPGAGASS